MNALLISVLCGLVWMSMAITPPRVQVYSRELVKVGKPNSLICYLNNFLPPEVSVDLLEDGVVMPSAVRSDLMFEQNWQYHLTHTVPFTPKEGVKYTCRVTHVGTTKDHVWDMDD